MLQDKEQKHDKEHHKEQKKEQKQDKVHHKEQGNPDGALSGVGKLDERAR